MLGRWKRRCAALEDQLWQERHSRATGLIALVRSHQDFIVDQAVSRGERVGELVAANNREVERRRAAEAQVRNLEQAQEWNATTIQELQALVDRLSAPPTEQPRPAVAWLIEWESENVGLASTCRIDYDTAERQAEKLRQSPGTKAATVRVYPLFK